MAEDATDPEGGDIDMVIDEAMIEAQQEAINRLPENGDLVKEEIRDLLHDQALPESDIVSMISERGYDQEGVQVVLYGLVGSGEVGMVSGPRESWSTISE